jgi:hypothetical protein
VSLLERLGRGHLSDATLARLWTDGLEAGSGTHPHLAGCDACRARLADFDQWIDGVASTLRDEADAMLTPDRLAAQQAQIARRLEALDRPARVLTFPTATRAVINGHSNVRRWVTAAAAACLIAGFGLGQVFPLNPSFGRQPAAAPSNLTRAVTETRALDLKPDVFAEEELLSDGYTRSHVQTLSALDDMTPHARDIVLNRRNNQYK